SGSIASERARYGQALLITTPPRRVPLSATSSSVSAVTVTEFRAAIDKSAVIIFFI
ncbi:MAG: hypothetical protein ACI85E_001206, partial [Marinomonas primoryensis]